MQNPPFFFIIGRPRSGTTLLRLLFESHPHLLIPPESPFIIIHYKKYGKITNWNEEVIRAFIDDLYKTRYFDKWLIDKELLTQKLLSRQGNTSFQEMVLEVYKAYKSVYKKKEILMIGDKNPMYSLYPGRIHQLFPESKIIHITRDYRDNFLSLINVNFEVPIVPIVIYRWKYALKKMWKLKAENPGLVYSIRYEDLVAEPELHTRRLCNFLGIEFDPSVLAFYEKKDEAQALYAGNQDLTKIHKSLFNPISTEKVNKWQTDMTQKQIKIADLVMGGTAEEAGYERMYKKFNLLLYLWILPALIYANIMYKLIMLGDHLPYQMRNSLNKSLGIFLKLYWKFNQRKVKPI
ncbi:MAG TPA: sulfotransferase [Lentimicrobium sp.]|nr:sulfotransferase [Lentimicrobium sp.]